MTAPRSPMMRVKDVCIALDCHSKTVYRMIHANGIPKPLRINSAYRWQREIIERWIADGCPKQEQEASAS